MKKSIYNNMSEKDLQIMCSDWISATYPELDTLFVFNSFQGMTLKGYQIALAKQTGGLKKNLTDFMLFKNNGKYPALFIELKKESPFLKDGITLRADQHIQDQYDAMELLRLEGYRAEFCWTLDQFKKLVIDHLDGK